MLSVLLFVIAGFLVLNSLLVIGTVNKQRETITPGVAVASTILSGLIVAVIVVAAVELGTR